MMCPPSAFQTTDSDASQEAANTTTSASSSPDFIPIDPISVAAYTYASQHLHPLILNHSLRVYLYAKALGEREKSSWTSSPARLALLFTACIFHDIGTTAAHDTGPVRFEIEGADAAERFLLQFQDKDGGEGGPGGVSEADAHEVWIAIALHSTPQIAERISLLSKLVRMGVARDFGRYALPVDSEGSVDSEFYDNGLSSAEVEAKLPRGEIEKVLGDAVVQQAVKRPGKAPGACWPGGLLKAHLEEPGWEGVNKAF